MDGLDQLASQISETLAESVKAHSLPAVCVSLGIAPGTADEAFQSKRNYANKRVVGLPKAQMIELAKQVYERFPIDSLQCAIEKFDAPTPFLISQMSRQSIFEIFDALEPLNGKLGIVQFMERLWDVRNMAPTGDDPRCRTAFDEIIQHMVENDDYTFQQMLRALHLDSMSNKKLVELLELIVHPLVRVGTEQSKCVDALNNELRRDGVSLIASDQVSGYTVFRLAQSLSGVAGAPKNLIFASTGPKPDIVLADAINNDIRITRNAEYCLVYDALLTANGLLWRELIAWWAQSTNSEVNEECERALYKRLRSSLSSEPERILFRHYYKLYRAALGERLPALLPQVYLHYDPYTLAELGGVRRLARQRMDFLILFSPFERVIIEVDGKHHYSDGDRSSPSKYAEMVKEDRDLRLKGYDVYRFGGAELTREGAQHALTDFFQALFRKHKIGRPE
jgi:hypothetical protein